MAKPEKRKEARRLRREEGLAITDICQRLGVSKASVSLWVRDIELTSTQQEELHRQHYAYRAQLRGSTAVAAKYRELRREYQEEGRAKAREGDLLHNAGCMLYWGEGEKSRNCFGLADSDPDMMVFFLKFLHESLQVEDQGIALQIICYLNNGLTQEEIEAYWLDALELPRECLRKTIVNLRPRSSQQKGRKLLYGMCNLRVFDTRLVQHVFGAIQEYTGIDKPEWLM
ncbi:MAG: hypothetical protein H6672_19285 [Anaerolineaceae bacterium]|nr:hypothetical protein [Anaerolineaceae bacterium]